MRRPRGTVENNRLDPANICIPDDSRLRDLAHAYVAGDLYYYLEQKTRGDQQPHMYCVTPAWAHMHSTLTLVAADAVTDYEATTSDHKEPPWVLTGVRNCYSLLRAMTRFVEDDFVEAEISIHLRELEAEWPTLVKDFGTYMSKEVMRQWLSTH